MYHIIRRHFLINYTIPYLLAMFCVILINFKTVLVKLHSYNISTFSRRKFIHKIFSLSEIINNTLMFVKIEKP